MPAATVPTTADHLLPDPDAPPFTGAPMLLDRLMPRYDAARREHLVIDGDLAAVHAAVLRADFMRAVTDSGAVRALFAARSSAERLAAIAARRPFAESPAPATLRLADMTSRGEWARLGDDPPREVAFGAVGRFWAGRPAGRRSTARSSPRSTARASLGSPATSRCVPTDAPARSSPTRRAPRPPTRRAGARSCATGGRCRPAWAS